MTDETKEEFEAAEAKAENLISQNQQLQQKLKAAENGLKAIQLEIENCQAYRSFTYHRECLETISLSAQETLDIINPRHEK